MKVLVVCIILLLLFAMTGCKGLEDESFKPLLKDYSDTSYLDVNESTTNMTEAIEMNESEEEDNMTIEG